MSAVAFFLPLPALGVNAPLRVLHLLRARYFGPLAVLPGDMPPCAPISALVDHATVAEDDALDRAERGRWEQ